MSKNKSLPRRTADELIALAKTSAIYNRIGLRYKLAGIERKIHDEDKETYREMLKLQILRFSKIDNI